MSTEGQFSVEVDGVILDGNHKEHDKAVARVHREGQRAANRLNKRVTAKIHYPDTDTFTFDPLPMAADEEPVPEPDPIPEPEPDPIPDPVPVPKEPPIYRGIPNPSYTLGFDVFADYPIDEVIEGGRNILEITRSGQDGRPYVVDLRRAVFERLVVRDSVANLILLGGQVISTTETPFIQNGRNVVVKGLDVGGDNRDFGHGTGCELFPQTVWIGGAVHNFGVLNTDREQDQHGFKIFGPDIWILDAELYGLSGDGIQMGDASRGEAVRCYAGGGYYHDNRENGVDIKDSRDCVVSTVRMDGFASTESSQGEAIVIHDDAYNAKVFDCDLSGCGIGIYCSGGTERAANHDFVGNTIKASNIGIDLVAGAGLLVDENNITAPTRLRVSSNVRRSARFIQD